MIKKILAGVLMVMALGFMAAMPAAASVDAFPNCKPGDTSVVCKATSDKLFGPGSLWTNILDTFTFLIGGIAVLMIIIGGIRYITSAGDQNGITAAKNTILYAVIGLVVAMLAYSIVHFVISNI
jgi:hypothetical protein